MRSPPSSSTMFLMREPRTPTQAPTQSTFRSMLETAILAAVAGLAGQGLDLDGAVGDFGNFVLEQPAHEIGMRARQDDLDAMADLPDVEDDRLDALADVVRFAGNLLAARQDGFGLAQADDGRPALVALDGAVDQVALHGLRIREDGVALGLADLLDHHLLGALGGDAAKDRRGRSPPRPSWRPSRRSRGRW